MKKDDKSKERLTLCFHAGGDVNCSSVHYSGHLQDGLGRCQDEQLMLRHQRWNLEGILFDILKYPLSGNGVLIGFLHHSSSVCVSLDTLISLISLIVQVKFPFFLSQHLHLWSFSCVTVMNILLSRQHLCWLMWVDIFSSLSANFYCCKNYTIEYCNYSKCM